MQVNSVQQSPNFGMAMYFTEKGAKAFQEQATPRLVEHIERLAEKVKHTKTYNVEITADKDGNVVPRVVSDFANKYLPPYRANDPETKYLTHDYITVRAQWDGTNLGGACVPGNMDYPIILDYVNKAAAQEGYRTLKASEFDAAGEIASRLEAMHEAKEALEAQKKLIEQKAKEQAARLVESFGIKKPAGFRVEI